MQRASLLTRRAAAAPAAPAAPRRAVLVRAAATDNVRDAEAWVERWRAKVGPAAAPRAPPSSNGAGHGAGANGAGHGRPSAAAAPSGGAQRLQPTKSFSDGTLLFTADSLRSVSFDALLNKGKGQ